MTFTTGDRVQAWSEFLRWWAARLDESENPAVDEYYARDLAGRAWLAACEWTSTLRGDD
jgi:hypothetical protein